MPRIETVRYAVVHPENLSTMQTRDIGRLTYDSVRTDFPDREAGELETFTEHTARMRGDPNSGIGGPLLRRQQRYARPRSVLAFHGDQLLAHLPVADNASSRRPFPLSTIEIGAKLHRKDFISRRYLWLGYAALGPEVRDDIEKASGAVNPLDIMIALAVKDSDVQQPVSAYPWDEETTWRRELLFLGLAEREGEDKDIYPFGPDADSVHQERWVAESVAVVQERLLAKDGIQVVLANTLVEYA